MISLFFQMISLFFTENLPIIFFEYIRQITYGIYNNLFRNKQTHMQKEGEKQSMCYVQRISCESDTTSYKHTQCKIYEGVFSMNMVSFVFKVCEIIMNEYV
eukprot:TRINITY_DN13982_c0_g1_i1.p6 TRINITY_DN13982_c0_g1~~TRINITY_DN13982_c0_g1_i1.p6  ORF type:complete len:101 (+),score=0.64 TRINITY_DN13982_c0_g1_i1:553-855(+)